MEVVGYADAARWVYRQAIQPSAWNSDELITLAEIRQIHHAALTPVWDVTSHPEADPEEAPGNFRRHEIEPFLSGMQPPTWALVDSELAGWLAQARKLKARSDTFPEDIAMLHCRFEQIHPFLDGDGRTGRLILDLLLVRLGYPPAIIYRNERTAYLTYLRRADSGDCGALAEFLVRAILQNLYKVHRPRRRWPISNGAAGRACERSDLS